MISRRDFEEVAREMYAAKPGYFHGQGMFFAQWEDDVRALCRAFEKLNPSFDSEKFTRACEGV